MDAATILAFAKQGVALLGAVAWPIAALAIAGRFKEPISSLLARAQKVSAFGVEAHLPLQNQSAGSATSNPEAGLSSPKQLTVSPYPPAEPLLATFERNLEDHLDGEDLTPEQKRAWLIRIAGTWWLAARHEVHYRLIYGSQIRFLKYLNLVQKIRYADARNFFEIDAGPKEDPRITFEAWLGFLMDADDVVVTGDSPDDKTVTIQPLGRAFLAWMVSVAVVELKPL